MKRLKTAKFWFLVLNISLLLSFCCTTLFNQFITSSKVYSERISEKTIENDEKSAEQFNSSFIHEVALELHPPFHEYSSNYSQRIKFILPSSWSSPRTPPPDLM